MRQPHRAAAAWGPRREGRNLCTQSARLIITSRRTRAGGCRRIFSRASCPSPALSVRYPCDPRIAAVALRRMESSVAIRIRYGDSTTALYRLSPSDLERLGPVTASNNRSRGWGRIVGGSFAGPGRLLKNSDALASTLIWCPLGFYPHGPTLSIEKTLTHMGHTAFAVVASLQVPAVL